MSAHPRPQLSQEQGVTIVTFGAAFKTIQEEYLPSVGEVLVQTADRDPPLVAIDLAGVEFFSSSFIEQLFRLWNRLNKKQGRFVLCCLHPYCREVLKITNLQSLWKLCDTREAAIAELLGTPAAAK
jgi:anti-sigma B factor antagonist